MDTVRIRDGLLVALEHESTNDNRRKNYRECLVQETVITLQCQLQQHGTYWKYVNFLFDLTNDNSIYVGKVLSELRKYPVHGICLTVNLPKAPIGSERSLVGVRIKIAESEIQNTPWCVLAESKIQDTKGESRVFAIWFAICYTNPE